jgi:hypothetical protein
MSRRTDRQAKSQPAGAGHGEEWVISTEELASTLYLIGIWSNETPALEEAAELFIDALDLLDVKRTATPGSTRSSASATRS